MRPDSTWDTHTPTHTHIDRPIYFLKDENAKFIWFVNREWSQNRIAGRLSYVKLLLRETLWSGKHFATGNTLLRETLCYGKHFATGNTLLRETLCYGKHFATGNPLFRETLCYGRPCVTGDPVLRETLCYGRNFVMVIWVQSSNLSNTKTWRFFKTKFFL